MENIVIIDNYPVMRKGIKQLISEMDLECSIVEADTNPISIKKILSVDFDFVIMDLEIPKFDGIQLIKSILDKNPHTKIIVFTICKSAHLIHRAIQTGIKGYVLKSSSYDELITAVNKVRRGKMYLCENTLEIYHQYRNSPIDEEIELLSAREREILQMIVKGDSLKGIASTLGVSCKTVSTYKQRLMRKLNIVSNPDLIIYSVEKGYR